jgi:hypothetical protein
MSKAVAEPLQSVIEHLPPIQLPSLSSPALQGLVERLPERFQPEPPHRSRKPLLFLLLLVGGAVVFMVMRRRSSSGEEIPTYDGATGSMGDAPFVDVR